MNDVESEMERQFIEKALFTALDKNLDHEIEGVSHCSYSPFGNSSNNQVRWESGFIGKGTKGPSKNKILSFEIHLTEKHVWVLNKVTVEWIKSMEKLNILENEPKIIWWFGKVNFGLRDEVLDLLGEFRTVQISDDIRPKVSFFVETKKRELFLDFAN